MYIIERANVYSEEEECIKNISFYIKIMQSNRLNLQTLKRQF
ncbi:hypothetical protein P4489_07025 [Heyndrickxia sporothermodurans]|nr:hypothetical protein [Heyndrickxia sporothermodurans]